VKTIVEIEWDEPQMKEWLCADNIAIALHAYCPNTKFKVKDFSSIEQVYYSNLINAIESGSQPVKEDK